MADHETHESPGHPVHRPMAKIVELLEGLDNYAHVVVAVMLIVMAGTILAHTCLLFAEQAKLITTPRPAAIEAPSTSETHEAAVAAPAGHETAPPGEKPSPSAAAPVETERPSLQSSDPFFASSLELLSSILFVVIVLELLRTIITYLQTHNVQSIMQEFLVVGIISSVRKILLVGAASSLSGSKGSEFIQEATGTLILVVGILALIGGLVMLRRAVVSEPSQHA